MINFLDELEAAGLGRAPWTGDAKIGFWEQVAHMAVCRFEDKADFLTWVWRNYQAEENRFVASCCWDIIKLREAPDGEESSG